MSPIIAKGKTPVVDVAPDLVAAIRACTNGGIFNEEKASRIWWAVLSDDDRREWLGEDEYVQELRQTGLSCGLIV